MAVMSDQDHFSNVTWSDHVQEQTARASADEQDGLAEAQSTTADQDVQKLVGERLECTVTSPIKENDGSKDAFVSYLITTNVRSH
jgi:sorting nexin-4